MLALQGQDSLFTPLNYSKMTYGFQILDFCLEILQVKYYVQRIHASPHRVFSPYGYV